MGGGPGLLFTEGMHHVTLGASGVDGPFILLRRGGAKGTWSRTLVHFTLGSV